MSVNTKAREQRARLNLQRFVEEFGEEQAKAVIREFLAAETGKHPGGRPTLDDGLELYVYMEVLIAKKHGFELPSPGKIVADFLFMAKEDAEIAAKWGKADQPEEISIAPDSDIPEWVPDDPYELLEVISPKLDGQKTKSLVTRVRRILIKMRKAGELPQGY